MSDAHSLDPFAPAPAEPVDLMLFFSSKRSSAGPVRDAAQRLTSILGDACTIHLVDITAEPEKAVEYRIVASPMIIRRSPGPERRVFGDLSDLDQVLKALDLR